VARLNVFTAMKIQVAGLWSVTPCYFHFSLNETNSLMIVTETEDTV